MGQLVEFPLQDGGLVLVEVSQTGLVGGPITRGGSGISERAQRSFEEAVGRVEPAAQAIITRLRGMAQTPDEVHVEFGLNLNAEVGAFITSASTTANFKIAVTWRHT
jgi:hypothetical protein